MKRDIFCRILDSSTNLWRIPDEKNYTHLTQPERDKIQELRDKGYGIRAIARMLGRGKTTISNECERNTVSGTYTAKKAQHKATVRYKVVKYLAKKLVSNPEPQAFVDRALLN